MTGKTKSKTKLLNEVAALRRRVVESHIILAYKNN